MNPVRILRNAAGLTQQQLATIADTSQPTIAAYESDRKSPTWRTVERMAKATNRHVDLRCLPSLTREERRSIALHAAISHRLEEDPQGVLTRARASLRRMQLLHPAARPLLDEWRVLLRRPLSALMPVLVDPAPWSRELRQVTPFTGVLSARERAEVYRQFAHDETSAVVGRRSTQCAL